MKIFSGDIDSEKLWFDKLENVELVKLTDTQVKNILSLQKIRKHFEEANAKFDQNEFAECISEIEEGFKSGLISTHYDILRIECLIMVGRFSAANDLIEKLPNKGDPRISYIQGLWQYHIDQYAEAIKYFENYQKFCEKCDKTSQFLIGRKNHDKTSQYLIESYQIKDIMDEVTKNKDIKKIDPYILEIDNDEIKKRLYYQRALLNKMLNNKDQEVIHDCTKALVIDSKYQNPRILRAQTYTKIFEHEESANDFKILMEIDAKNFENNLGKIKKITFKETLKKLWSHK